MKICKQHEMTEVAQKYGYVRTVMIVSLLSLSILLSSAMTGCKPKDSESATEIVEKALAKYEKERKEKLNQAIGQANNAKMGDLINSHRDPPVQGLSDPKHDMAREISGYDDFKAQFKKASGVDWETFVQNQQKSLDKIENWKPTNVEVESLIKLVKDAAAQGKPSEALSTQLTNLAKKVETTANKFNTTVEMLRQRTEPLRSNFKTVLDNVEKVKGIADPTEAKAAIRKIIENDIRALLAETEKMQSGDVKQAVTAVVAGKADLEQASNALTSAWNEMGKYFPAELKSEVESKVKEVTSTVNEAVESAAIMAMALPALAEGIKAMAAFAMANPYIAAAIAAALIIMALLKFAFGGGSGDGDGKSKGAEGGSGSAPGQQQPGKTEATNNTSKGSDAERKDNPGQSDPAFNKMTTPEGDLGTIGGDPKGSIKFRTFQSDNALAFQVMDPAGLQFDNLVLDPSKALGAAEDALMERLSEIKSGKRHVNVQAISIGSRATAGYPIQIRLSGFNKQIATESSQYVVLEWASSGAAVKVTNFHK